mgnify:CR=1 FL=1
MGLEADTRKNTLINDASMVTLPSSNVPKINKIPGGRNIEETLNKLPPNPVSDNDENNYSEGGIIDNNEQYNRPPYDPKTLIFEDMYTHQNVGL